MKKLLAFMLILVLIVPTVLADGMMWDPHGPVIERGQYAMINFEDGLQRMLISVQSDEIRGDKGVWIFPVPAGPDDVAIDIIPNMPRLYGREVTSSARNTIDKFISVIGYPLVLPFMFQATKMYASVAEGARDLSILSGQGVTVYEHIEKEGVVTELVGAEDGREIYLYLVNKGLDITYDTIPVLRDYANQDYTFVLSWFSSQTAAILNSRTGMPYRTLGIEVMFPTDKPYYPLKPTSIYDSTKIPAAVFLFGGYKPEVYDKIAPFVDTEYYVSYSLPDEKQFEAFYGGLKDEIPYSSGYLYTLVEINDVPSKYFEEDLWFEEYVPDNISYGMKILNFLQKSTILGFVISIILSIGLASLLGLLFFRKEWWKFAIVGLFNILTIVPFIIAAIVVRVGRIDPKLKKQIKEAGYIAMSKNWLKKLGFIVAFIVAYALVLLIIGGILKFPL